MRKKILLFSVGMFALVLAGCLKTTPADTTTNTNTSGDTTMNNSAMAPEGTITYVVSRNDSKVEWRGKKVFVDTEHIGTVQLKSGEIFVQDGQPVGGNFVLDMTTISDQELASDKMRQQLEAHLKSADFFDVEQYPEAKLVATSVVPIEQKDVYNITADLTIKDQTHEITFPARVAITENGLVADASFIIDRTRWGVVYGSGNFFKELGDAVIDDNVRFNVTLSGSTQ